MASTFTNSGDMYTALQAGKATIFGWRKAPAVTTTGGVWQDLSMAPGVPPPNYNYYGTPLKAATITDQGIFVGGNVSPSSKFITDFNIMASAATPLPMEVLLCDYVLVYPIVDQGTTDVQSMDNTVTLPRYTDGVGLQIMAVLVAPQSVGCQFSVSYTNSAGVSGRSTGTVTCNNSTNNGAIINSALAVNGAGGPFLPLARGDLGVKSIDSVTVTTTDVGLFSLVLVKPIARSWLYQQGAPNERSYVTDFRTMPPVADGAYLNILACGQAGSMAGVTFMGTISSLWT